MHSTSTCIIRHILEAILTRLAFIVTCGGLPIDDQCFTLPKQALNQFTDPKEREGLDGLRGI